MSDSVVCTQINTAADVVSKYVNMAIEVFSFIYKIKHGWWFSVYYKAFGTTSAFPSNSYWRCLCCQFADIYTLSGALKTVISNKCQLKPADRTSELALVAHCSSADWVHTCSE
jgi:hypothetical protein